MSRIGKKPVPILSGVLVTINGHSVSMKGAKGSIARDFTPDVKIARENDLLICTVPENSSKVVRSKFGLVRSLLANMMTGVTRGYTRQLEIVGLGYKAKVDGPKVVFTVVYSHSVAFESPKGVSVKIEGVNKIVVSGIDKEKVGQVAADIRAIKPPEHYNAGKGIRYVGEKVRIKEGKKLAA